MDREPNEKQAELLKKKGNEEFIKGNVSKSIELYTQSIHLYPTSMCYGNRSFAYYKLERFEEALQDATTSVQLDKHYPKGYFRRAEAQMALKNYDQAIKDYEHTNSLQPVLEISDKIDECMNRKQDEIIKKERNDRLNSGIFVIQSFIYKKNFIHRIPSKIIIF